MSFKSFTFVKFCQINSPFTSLVQVHSTKGATFTQESIRIHVIHLVLVVLSFLCNTCIYDNEAKTAIKIPCFALLRNVKKILTFLMNLTFISSSI